MRLLMPYIEMQDMSKNNDKTSPSSLKRMYKKFPFFVGYEMKLYLDRKALSASMQYRSQSADSLTKPINRFWKSDKTLVNVCCESIAKQLIEHPHYYAKRSEILPAELNKVINQKLEEAEHGMMQEKFSTLKFKLSSI